jgi:3-dehydroquinate synthase
MVRKKSIDILSRKTSYDIWIGEKLLKKKNKDLKFIFASKKIAIISDKNVHTYQYSNLLDQISDLRINPHLLLIEPGESSKSWNNLQKVLGWLTDLNFDRTDYVIAFGGGVVGDLVSLAASLFRRGINLIQIPTTLLSQVDSSVGGKTAVNSGSAKNSIGTFFHPKAVFCDITFLGTLSERNFLAGYAEVLKMALVFDEDFYQFLIENRELIAQKEKGVLIHIIEKSLEIKSKIVEIDETEQGDRALLNFGHTFGHALESYFDYSEKLLHGEAVSLGIVLAARFSNQEGYLSDHKLEDINDHLKAMKLPTVTSQIHNGKLDVVKLLKFMKQDKKVVGDNINLILLKDVGNGFIERNVSFQKLEKFLQVQLS